MRRSYAIFAVCLVFARELIHASAVNGRDISRRRAEINPDVGLVAFSVARSQDLKGHKQTQSAVSFDHEFVNTGGHFNLKQGIFIAPVSGSYEITFTGGGLPHRKMSLLLMKNNFEVQALAYDGHTRGNPRVQHQNLILELEQHDRIWLKLADGQQYGVSGQRSNSYVTTFSGHLLQDTELNDVTKRYKRHKRGTNKKKRATVTREVDDVTIANSQTAIAFSAACRRSVFGGDVTGKDPSHDVTITYDKIFVNVGNSLNWESGIFTAPTPGVYYFSFTVGKFPKKKLSVSLMKNDNLFQVMVYNESKSRYREMQSQSVILQLVRGDTVWLKTYNSKEYAVYSNLGSYITFSGYLVAKV
ncbi:complement C1q tumor necrosis factor-related protein 4-like [Ciona intestinalis]